MRSIFSRKFIDKAFEIGILVKAIFGFFEILGGALLIFSVKLITDNFIIYLAQEQIADDPNDAIANYLIKIANNLSQDSRFFAVAYLVFHGAVNIFLAVALTKKKLKAHLWAMAFFGIFVFYQLYKYFHNHSLALLLLIIFDVCFIYVIYLEYKRKVKAVKATGK